MHDDSAYCRRITLERARTFGIASALLPRPKRRATYALYAFCRQADDLADAPGPSLEERRDRLGAMRRDLDRAVHGDAADPVFREVRWALDTFGIPAAPLVELLDGVARDLEPARVGGWADLERYCEGVASSVGEMCAHVFGLPADPRLRARAVSHARTLGTAMQLTNILRDVGEDARNGRCYLPEEELARFALTPDDVLANPRIGRDDRWRPLMALLIGRARSLYEAARPGFALLDADARGAARACAVGYAGILRAIERLDYDTVSTRATLGMAARAQILYQAWRASDPRADAAAAPSWAPALAPARRSKLATHA